MKTLKIFIITVAILLLALIGIVTYFGSFKQIEFTVKIVRGEIIVYEEMTGHYRQSSFVMDRVYYSLLKEFPIETYKELGIYFDNPKLVEVSELRSEVVSMLEEDHLSRIPEIKKLFKVRQLLKIKSIVAEFPYKGKLSVILGIMKVYPGLSKFVKEKGYDEEGEIIEIYDISAKKIVYREKV